MKLSRVVLAVVSAFSAATSAVQLPTTGVYAVELLPVNEAVRTQVGSGINDQGTVVGSASFVYSLPFDLDALDLESQTIKNNFTEEQIAKIKAKDIDLALQEALLVFFSSNSGYIYQRLGDVQALNLSTGSQVKIREQGEFPTSREFLMDINNSNYALGMASSVFVKQSFTPAPTEAVPQPVAQTLWVPQNPREQAFLVNGTTVTALPIPYTAYSGGFSYAEKMSATRYIAGSGSVGYSEGTVKQIEEACKGEASPVAICHFNYAGQYHERALVWKINDDGSVAAPTQYGFLGPEITIENYTPTYVSRALAVNDDGYAVGYSTYNNESRNMYERIHATIFHDGEVAPIIDATEWYSSYAVDVNDDKVIIGTAFKTINGLDTSRFFVHEATSGKTTFPTGFFASANIYPKAINADGLVVGSTEVLPLGDTIRRQVAFLYDSKADTFTNLNTLLPCDTPYHLVDAQGINNKNEIIATVVLSQDKRDVLGEVVLDSSGQPEKENVPRTVKLLPIPNGQVADCGITNPDETYERASGSFGWVLTALLLPAVWLRRRER